MCGLGTVHQNPILNDRAAAAAPLNLLGALKTHKQVLAWLQ